MENLWKTFHYFQFSEKLRFLKKSVKSFLFSFIFEDQTAMELLSTELSLLSSNKKGMRLTISFYEMHKSFVVTYMHILDYKQ